MSEAMEKQGERPLAAIVDSKTVKDFLFTSETKLSDKQQNMFMQLAIRNQLDPFKREIYAIAYGGEFNIVTGYQVYIQRADATGKLNGWSWEPLKKGQGNFFGGRVGGVGTKAAIRQPYRYPATEESSHRRHGRENNRRPG